MPSSDTQFKPGNKLGNKFVKGWKGSNYWLGKTFSPEHRAKLSAAKKGSGRPNRFGPDAPGWKGGKVAVTQCVRSHNKYAEWRTSVFERDCFTCQSCGDNKGGNLEADHIIPLKVMLKEITDISKAITHPLLWDKSNGRTLCRDCHMKTDTYGNKSLKLSN